LSEEIRTSFATAFFRNFEQIHKSEKRCSSLLLNVHFHNRDVFVCRGMEDNLRMMLLKSGGSVAVADIGHAKNLGSAILMVSQFQFADKKYLFRFDLSRLSFAGRNSRI